LSLSSWCAGEYTGECGGDKSKFDEQASDIEGEEGLSPKKTK
jgi:hypothetical protein